MAAKFNKFTFYITIYIINIPNLKVSQHSITSPKKQATINNPTSITKENML